MRFAVPLLVLVLILNTSSLASIQEFIWRDRWNQSDELFRQGYATGVLDIVNILTAIGLAANPHGSGLLLEEKLNAAVIRAAHLCIVAKPLGTIKDATAFAAHALATVNNPQESAAFAIVQALVLCGDPNGARLLSTSQGVATHAYVWVWKDLWYRDDPNVQNGYVAGLTDTIQYLDNSGKRDSVLYSDILKSVQCAGYRLKLSTVGQLMVYAHKAVEHQGNDDPLASTSGVIFNTLVACKNL